MLDDDGTILKSVFAVMRGVTAGRVSQWIGTGKIRPEALVGDGRAAKIRLGVAMEHLKERLEPSQRFGANGLSTGERKAPAVAPQKTTPAPDSGETKIKAGKLRPAQLETRKREEKISKGVYVRFDDAKTEIVKTATPPPTAGPNLPLA